VEAVLEGDDLEGAALVQLPPLSRQLDGALVGLRAGVGEKDAVERGMRRQQFRQRQRGRVEIGRARIDQTLRLPRQRVLHGRVAMAEGIHRPALDEIEVALAVGVDEPGALAVHHDEAGPLGGPHQRLRVVCCVLHVLSPEMKKATGLPWPLR